MPIIKPYDTGWNECISFLFDVTLDIIAYNLAYMIDNAIFILAIIKCTIELILGMLTIMHDLLKITLFITTWVIKESSFWIMSKVSESVCRRLPAKGSKRQVESKRNMKYKRRRNSGGEATALYFLCKRYFNRFQRNHCNGRQRKKKFGRYNTTKRSKKRPSKKKRVTSKFKKRITHNRSRTNKHKKYHHKLGSATTSKVNRDKVETEVPVESKVPEESKVKPDKVETEVPVESKVPEEWKVTVPVRKFIKLITTVTNFIFKNTIPEQIEQAALAHMEDNTEKVDSTTGAKQERSSKPRSGKQKVKFQK